MQQTAVVTSPTKSTCVQKLTMASSHVWTEVLASEVYRCENRLRKKSIQLWSAACQRSKRKTRHHDAHSSSVGKEIRCNSSRDGLCQTQPQCAKYHCADSNEDSSEAEHNQWNHLLGPFGPKKNCSAEGTLCFGVQHSSNSLIFQKSFSHAVTCSIASPCSESEWSRTPTWPPSSISEWWSGGKHARPATRENEATPRFAVVNTSRV